MNGSRAVPAFGPPSSMPDPQNFKLKTQTSQDIEGGFRIKSGEFQMQSSIYGMDLENEIHFNPALFSQRQSRSHPPLRRRDQRLAARQRQRAVPWRHGLYPAVFREGPSRATTCHWCPATRATARRDLEYLAELPGARRHAARLERHATWTTIRAIRSCGIPVMLPST